MIALTETVLRWYQQHKTPKLFAQAIGKQRRISINEIVNINAQKKGDKRPNTELGNTLSLLCLVRRRGACLREYLRCVGYPHRKTADRLLRRLHRADSRKSKQD